MLSFFVDEIFSLSVTLEASPRCKMTAMYKHQKPAGDLNILEKICTTFVEGSLAEINANATTWGVANAVTSRIWRGRAKKSKTLVLDLVYDTGKLSTLAVSGCSFLRCAFPVKEQKKAVPRS